MENTSAVVHSYKQENQPNHSEEEREEETEGNISN